MKRLILILALLLVIPIIHAQSIVSDFNEYSYVTVNFNLEGEFSIKEKGNEAQIFEILANLSFIPREDSYNQKIQEIKTTSTPPAQITTGDTITYSWNNPQEHNYKFGVSSKIKVDNVIAAVDEKIKFPIQQNLEAYTHPTEFIDITPRIRSKAIEIANGEDDLYVVTFKIGEWVRNNIKYDLSTLTADAVQKSSWVLEHKEGVCDEITNLFISMLRSLGIPARFVSGMAYTNIGNTWGPHAWAEVYFPNKGWVPFDVTYGQLGWLDPTHIKLKVSEDSGEASVRYSWKAINADLEAKDINITATLDQTGYNITSPIGMKLEPLVNSVGPGSYVPFSIELKNTNTYYTPVGLIIKKAPKLTESNFRPVLLKPQETKKFFWITRIEDNLEPGYSYKTTIEAEDQYHHSAENQIIYARTFKTITLEEAQRMISENEVEELNVKSPQLLLECTAPDHIFIYEPLKIDCKLRNTGNTQLQNIQTCLDSNCNTIEILDISQQQELTYKLNNLSKGIQSIQVISKSGSIETKDTIRFEVLNSPDLNLASIDYPETADYNQEFEINIVLSVKAPVKEIKIKIKDQELVTIDTLENSKRILIKTEGSNYLKEKKIPIHITFKDTNNKEYNLNKEYKIEIKNIPWYIKLLSWLGLI